MNRFRFDNTESYTRADLKLLNHRCNRALRKCKHSEEKWVQDRIAERVQAAFDTERARWRHTSVGRVGAGGPLENFVSAREDAIGDR